MNSMPMAPVIASLSRIALPCVALLLAACGGGGAGTGALPTSPASAADYTVGGTVTGLSAGNSLVLINQTSSGTDTLTLSNSASGVSQIFTFAAKLPNAASYKLTLVTTTPVAQPCTLTCGMGRINASNVTTVHVFCGLPGGKGAFAASAGLLATARADHTATLLPDGRVLVSGGLARTTTQYFATPSWLNIINSLGRPAAISSAELYDPANGGSWVSAGSMADGRTWHTATPLSDGRVLVSGGYGGSTATFLSSAELYDPVTGIWSATGSMRTARIAHTATRLPDGRVLVSGGYDGILLSSSALFSAELYDPVSGAWSGTSPMGTARYDHTATLLSDGRVLVSGGSNGNGLPDAGAELYDPATGVWTPTGSMGTARYDHTATLLPDGRVLVSGGSRNNGATLASAELYDPATGVWTATGSLATRREHHTATLLPDGRVLVSGGNLDNRGTPVGSAELYDPATGVWTPTNFQMAAARTAHTATLLPDGKVLVSGGYDASGNAIASAELYF
jgi:hypothetical protein